jgi:hypothetical protein
MGLGETMVAGVAGDLLRRGRASFDDGRRERVFRSGRSWTSCLTDRGVQIAGWRCSRH